MEEFEKNIKNEFERDMHIHEVLPPTYEFVKSISPTSSNSRLISTFILVSSIITLAIIMTIVLLALKEKDIPEVLQDWGGVIIGFYFGSMFGFIKDLTLNIRTSRSDEASK